MDVLFFILWICYGDPAWLVLAVLFFMMGMDDQ